MLVELLKASLHLGGRKILIAVVDRFKFAPINGDDGLLKEFQPTTQFNEFTANLTDRCAEILTEIGDGLMIRHKALSQPHQFHVALGLSLKTTAGLNPVEVAVNVELQQC